MQKIKKIELWNYKVYSKFSLSSRAKNVLVGPNNVGKSTALDAFRITFDALRYSMRRTAVFKSHGEDGVCSTFNVPKTAIQTDLRNSVHNFGEGKAKIKVSLENGNNFNILIGDGADIECFLKTEVQARKNTTYLREQFPLSLTIVPTLSPLEQDEPYVTETTLERNRYSRLASRNFRNFWLRRSDEEFSEFADLVELGWPGVRILRPEIDRSDPKRPTVRMLFRQGQYVREVQWAGYGFQVWMQTMMHLTDTNHNSVLILDEPDIYLHPDLQHKLLRFVGKRVGQFFIATHSTEIINDVDPADILILRPNAVNAKRIKNDTGYMDVYTAIGSSENAQFARLAKTRKVLYFEGNDRRILGKMAKRFCNTDFLSDGSITFMKTDGFSNWHRVTTSSWVFENFFGFKIPVSAVFDRDYRCDDEIKKFIDDANNNETLCKVLPVKELENLLLVPSAIKKVVSKFSKIDLPDSWMNDIDNIFEEACEQTKSTVLSRRIGSRIDYLVNSGIKSDIQTISAEEEKKFTQEWNSQAYKASVIPGKSVLAKITTDIQEKFSVSLTPTRLIDEIEVGEFNSDVRQMIYDIEAHLLASE
jgi:hypothetical protein